MIFAIITLALIVGVYVERICFSFELIFSIGRIYFSLARAFYLSRVLGRSNKLDGPKNQREDSK